MSSKTSLAAKMGKFLQSSGVEDEISYESDSGGSMDEQANAIMRDPSRVYAPIDELKEGFAKPKMATESEASSAERKALNAQAMKEVETFAEYLGMNLAEDRDLLWIAVEAMTAPLPPNWTVCDVCLCVCVCVCVCVVSLSFFLSLSLSAVTRSHGSGAQHQRRATLLLQPAHRSHAVGAPHG
jgi:hypothetical protein